MNNQVNQENYEIDKNLIDEELKKLENDASALDEAEIEERKKKIIEMISALRKEVSRISEKKEKVLSEDTKNFFEEYRRKNIQKAFDALKKEFADLSQDENKSSRVLETFEKISDKSAFDVEEILSDLKRAYASVNADILLEKTKKLEEIVSSGEGKKVELGGVPSTSGGSSTHESYPPEVIELANKLGKKPEEVKDYIDRTPMSGGWTY